MYGPECFARIIAQSIRAQNEQIASQNPAFAVSYLTRSIQRRFDRCCHR